MKKMLILGAVFAVFLKLEGSSDVVKPLSVSELIRNKHISDQVFVKINTQGARLSQAKAEYEKFFEKNEEEFYNGFLRYLSVNDLASTLDIEQYEQSLNTRVKDIQCKIKSGDADEKARLESILKQYYEFYCQKNNIPVSFDNKKMRVIINREFKKISDMNGISLRNFVLNVVVNYIATYQK